MSSLNQTAWYMSNRFRELNRLNNSGLRPLANSIAPSLWGISVPNIDAMAMIIKSTMVSLTELKKAQMILDFFFVLNIFMDIWVIKLLRNFLLSSLLNQSCIGVIGRSMFIF